MQNQVRNRKANDVQECSEKQGGTPIWVDVDARVLCTPEAEVKDFRSRNYLQRRRRWNM